MNRADRKRERDGKYAVEQRCDACSEPIRGGHITDDEVCRGDDGPGFLLCARKRCPANAPGFEDKSVAERRAVYEAGRAVSEAKERARAKGRATPAPVPRKMGRPVDPSARRERVLVRATPEQLAAWEAAAAEAGHSVGTWLWWIANRAAEQSR